MLMRVGRGGSIGPLKASVSTRIWLAGRRRSGPCRRHCARYSAIERIFPGGHSLTDATIAALDASATLIVLCSPVSASRPAVNEEARLFRSRHPERPVIPVIIDGAPPENFPPALRYELAADGAITDRPITILGPDLRDNGDGKNLGLAKLVAGLTGISADDVFRRAERARKRRNRFWGALAGVFFALTVIATGSAFYAWRQLKANEAFLDATLERFTGVVQKAVSLSQSYAVPLSVTLGFLKEAEDMLDVVARHGRPTPKLTYRRAIMLVAFAHSYRQLGQMSEWESRAAEARELMVTLVAREPNNVDWLVALGSAYQANGDFLRSKGDLAAALAEYRAQHEILKRLAKANPDNAFFDRNLPASYQDIGDVLFAQGNLAEALESFRESLSRSEYLAAVFPDKQLWQDDLPLAYDRVGDVLGPVDIHGNWDSPSRRKLIQG
jgi:tetratricopeptide (TPR) repeat protein